VDAPIGFGEAEADDGFKSRSSRDVRRMGCEEHLPTGLLRGEPLLDVLEQLCTETTGMKVALPGLFDQEHWEEGRILAPPKRRRFELQTGQEQGDVH
jgi:hypothetical protein